MHFLSHNIAKYIILVYVHLDSTVVNLSESGFNARCEQALQTPCHFMDANLYSDIFVAESK